MYCADTGCSASFNKQQWNLDSGVHCDFQAKIAEDTRLFVHLCASRWVPTLSENGQIQIPGLFKVLWKSHFDLSCINLPTQPKICRIQRIFFTFFLFSEKQEVPVQPQHGITLTHLESMLFKHLLLWHICAFMEDCSSPGWWKALNREDAACAAGSCHPVVLSPNA